MVTDNKTMLREKLNNAELPLVEEEKLTEMAGSMGDQNQPQTTVPCGIAATVLVCPTNRCTVECPWAPWN